MTTVHEFKRNNLYRIDTTDGEAFAVSVQIDDDELLELCRIIVGIERQSEDTDGDMEALASLPTEVYTPSFLCQEQYDDVEEFLDDVSDWLSDEYGWCHFGFDVDDEKDK